MTPLRLPAAALLLAGCCAGETHLNFGLREYVDIPDHGTGIGETAPRWGASAALHSRDELIVTTDLDTELHPDVLELFDAAGAPVELACKTVDVREPDTGSCPHRARTCSLATLAPGDYTLVHRERFGTGQPINCGGDCPFVDFQGEPALVLTLMISE